MAVNFGLRPVREQIDGPMNLVAGPRRAVFSQPVIAANVNNPVAVQSVPTVRTFAPPQTVVPVPSRVAPVFKFPFPTFVAPIAAAAPRIVDSSPPQMFTPPPVLAQRAKAPKPQKQSKAFKFPFPTFVPPASAPDAAPAPTTVTPLATPLVSPTAISPLGAGSLTNGVNDPNTTFTVPTSGGGGGFFEDPAQTQVPAIGAPNISPAILIGVAVLVLFLVSK